MNATRAARTSPRFSRQISGEYAITHISGKVSPRTLWSAVIAPNVFFLKHVFGDFLESLFPIFMVAWLNHGKFVNCTTNRTSTRGSKPVRFEKLSCGDQLSSRNIGSLNLSTNQI